MCRCAYKLVLTCGFIFDKSGSNRALLCILCAGFNAFILNRKLRGSFLFNKEVHYMSLFYEILALWLFGSIAIHLLAEITLYSSALLLVLCSSLICTVIFIVHENQRISILLTLDDPVNEIRHPEGLY